jgi:mono/diheme cytochrome c family protein
MFKTIMIFVAMLSLVGCSQENSSQALAKTTSPQKISNIDTPPRRTGFAQVARGGKLYLANCATCHGSEGQGEFNWKNPRPDGLNPAPPLNGSGHAWHHPKKILLQTIKYGSPGGKARMQPWKEKLNDQEIEDITAWFISKWPQEIYSAWYQRTKGL